MSFPLFAKTANDQKWAMFLTLAVVFVFPVIIIHSFLTFPLEQLGPILEWPFVKAIIETLTGANMADVFTVNALGAFPFVHPVILAVTWAYIITSVSRSLVGEIENGTMDCVLSLPMTRSRLYASTLTWTLTGCIMIPLVQWLGTWIGAITADLPEPMNVAALWRVVINDMALLIAVGGVAALVSVISSRRGVAILAVFGFLIASFALNWFVSFWPAVQPLAFLGILNYFRPVIIVRDHCVPWDKIVVLLGMAAVTTTVGGVYFNRRDIEGA